MANRLASISRWPRGGIGLLSACRNSINKKTRSYAGLGTLLDCSSLECGGERGIRTLDTLLTYTHFPGVLLKPLGHLSNIEAEDARFELALALTPLSV